MYAKDIEQFVDIIRKYSVQPLIIKHPKKMWMESCICHFVFGSLGDFYVVYVESCFRNIINREVFYVLKTTVLWDMTPFTVKLYYNVMQRTE
jgi:hypothetical protein